MVEYTWKIKAGYAGNGNDRIGDFPQRDVCRQCPYGGQAGQHPTQLANPDLKWETTYDRISAWKHPFRQQGFYRSGLLR